MFPKMTSTEGIVCYLMIRRKWLIRWYPEKEEYFKKIFKSNENIINKVVIKEGDNFESKIAYLKLILHQSVEKTLKSRTGEEINLNYLYTHYPEGFSITFTYEPKDLMKAAKSYSIELMKTLINYSDKDEWIIRNLDKEWIRCVHKRSRRTHGDKFLLLDFDCNFDNKYKVIENLWYNRVLPFLKDKKLENNVTYVVTTPSCGLHCVLKIDKQIQNIFFKNRDKFLNDLKIASGVKPEVLVRDFMTHYPFNSQVQVIYYK